MGCDIHCYKEKRIDGVWVNQNEISDPYGDGYRLQRTYVSRNYWLFGLLSKGVRTEWESSWEPRGEAPAMSQELQQEYDNDLGDGHSHSWLTLDEIKVKQVKLLIGSPEDNKLGVELRDFRNTIFDENDDPETTRVVFWFDN
jgi:hypothetical protein